MLARLRAGDTDRQVARTGLMGREKEAAFRALAGAKGWLRPERALPDEAESTAAVGAARRARTTVSGVEPSLDGGSTAT